jgi:retron-type reverse transcriptase
VLIPKPGGGQRQLGIPVVVDRLVQQMILQVLEPIFDPTFSDSSYGSVLGAARIWRWNSCWRAVYVSENGRE